MADMMIEPMSTRTSQFHCQNCGGSSHCGTAKYATVKDYACDGGEYREIKICDSCRCTNCQKKNIKRGEDG